MGLTCTGFALARSFVADSLAPPHLYVWLMSIDQTCFIPYSNEIHRPKLCFIWPVIRILSPSPQLVCIYLVPRVLAPYLFPHLTIAYPMLSILALWLF